MIGSLFSLTVQAEHFSLLMRLLAQMLVHHFKSSSPLKSLIISTRQDILLPFLSQLVGSPWFGFGLSMGNLLFT